MHVAVDHRQLADRLAALVDDVSLRARLGAAGRERARTQFDWSVVLGRYQQLWAELDVIRANSGAAAWRSVAPGRLDPFAAFAHYPTSTMPPGIASLTDAQKKAADQTIGSPLFNFFRDYAPSTRDLPAATLAKMGIVDPERGD